MKLLLTNLLSIMALLLPVVLVGLIAMLVCGIGYCFYISVSLVILLGFAGLLVKNYNKFHNKQRHPNKSF